MTDPQLNALCEEFVAIFWGDARFTSKIAHDHQITLLPGTEPVNMRPYRHPWEQKNVIEKMIEMLADGIIRHKRSLYASPIVLVKKTNGTWRMCLDYRALNRRTIKDKYPIFLIDKLLDVLEALSSSSCWI